MDAASSRLQPLYPVVVFDLDGTLVPMDGPVWRRLHKGSGSDPERRRALVAQGRAGTLPYDQWFAGDRALLQAAGATRASLLGLLADLKPAAGARALIRDLRAGGTRVAILSGGVDLVRQVVFEDIPFDAVHLNRIEFDEAGAIVGGRATSFDLHRKVDGLWALARQFGVAVSQVAFIGDGPNDVDAARTAGCSVAWGPSPDPGLIYAAHHRVVGPDMSLLRPILFGTA